MPFRIEEKWWSIALYDLLVIIQVGFCVFFFFLYVIGFDDFCVCIYVCIVRIVISSIFVLWNIRYVLWWFSGLFMCGCVCFGFWGLWGVLCDWSSLRYGWYIYMQILMWSTCIGFIIIVVCELLLGSFLILVFKIVGYNFGCFDMEVTHLRHWGGWGRFICVLPFNQED